MGSLMRQRREAIGLGVRELARRIGVSPSLVSQVERGLAMPSVSTLYAVARVLEISLDELFETAAQMSTGALVTRGGERPTIHLELGISWEQLFRDDSGAIELLRSVYPPGSESCPPSQMISHVGEEMGYVLRGTLHVTVGDEQFVLGPGDGIHYDSAIPHRLANEGRQAVHAVWLLVESERRAGDDRAH
jgi:transcriptional regulator with XRE-family HTH domain